MPTVEQYVASNEGSIIEHWADAAAATASARGLSRPELINILPRFVASLAHPRDGDQRAHRRGLIERHVAGRLRFGFDPAEVAEELILLGRCIASTWAKAPEAARPGAEDVEHLFTELQEGAHAATEMFTRHLLEDEQRDKRYRRLIEQVAQASLGQGEPRAEPLRRIAELIMAAMRADSATLLLLDVRTERLITAASVGLGDELLDEYTSLDQAGLPGRIAAEDEEPTEIRDVQTTELVVSETLRNSGIHSLLGVRLPMRHRLTGVLYIGLAETRAFTERELRRLEMLGDRLTLHLDSARLFGELEATIEDLRLERQLRERFVSMLAHDLQGPLAAIRILAQIIARHPTVLDDRRDLGQRLQASVDRATRMVRDLLDANLVHSGRRLPLDLGEADLAATVREVCDELVEVHGSRIAVSGPSEVRGTWDAGAVRRAVWNLVRNALEHGAPDEPVTVRVRPADDTVCVAVHNFGRALSPEEQRTLFEPFARKTANPPRKGWGLGLTLVRATAEAHGGRVLVDSGPDTGTTFTLELPLDARPHQPAEEG